MNDRPLDIPSAQLRRGDTVTVRRRGREAVRLQQSQGDTLVRPEWVEVDNEALSARVISLPDEAAIPFPIEMRLVIEFYS